MEDNLLTDLIELRHQEVGGQLYELLYKTGVMPTYINYITDEDSKAIEAYQEFLDFNNQYSLDYLESLILLVSQDGVIFGRTLSLYSDYPEVLEKIIKYFIGKEVFNAPEDVDKKVRSFALKIVKEQLMYNLTTKSVPEPEIYS